MGRVIFHVGPEKTGSTLLQTYFEANAPRIVDASGRQAVMMYPAQVRNSGLLAEAQAVTRGDGRKARVRAKKRKGVAVARRSA